MNRLAIPSLFLFLGCLCLGSASAARAAETAPEVRYTYLSSGNKAGEATTRAVSAREWIFTFEYNDRGRGPKTSTRMAVDEQWLPVRIETTGNDYWKTPVTERFERTGNRSTWTNSAEKEERQLERPAFYLGINAPPQEIWLLAKALLAAPGGKLPLLPAGEMQIEETGSIAVAAGDRKQTVHLYALTGGGLEPGYVWLDAGRNLFASHGGWPTLIVEGWEAAAPEIARFQDAKVAEREAAESRRLVRRPAGPLAIRGARLFDPATGAVQAGTTVVVSGNRITAVGRDGAVEIPAGAEVIDAGGKFLMPGLWDMHTHLSSLDGRLHVAAGVTTARDLANDIDQLTALRKRFDAGEAVGPRVFAAGFMDAPGPYAGPTKVLVDNEKDALTWVDRYAELGYIQVKLYSSLDPKIVAPVAKRAHERGMRVSGHIPNGMTAADAVRAGFDEIQHANFLFLNFVKGVDTRTPARFSAVAENAASLDLASPEVRSFVQLLKEKGTVLDPTVGIFEGMFLDRPGENARGTAMVSGRMPPQLQRYFKTGGLNPPADKVKLYADSYRKMLDFLRVLHEAGVQIVPGTDALAGFALHRELELYVEAGIPAAHVLRMATLDSARVVKKDGELGTIAPGKLADLILIDGDPLARMADVRRVVLTVKDGIVFDPAAVYASIGIKPAV
jgi:cytosine/adenosine deaminase-related metal-dependent hydrolase